MITLSWYRTSLSTKNDPVKILMVKAISVRKFDRLIMIGNYHFMTPSIDRKRISL